MVPQNASTKWKDLTFVNKIVFVGKLLVSSPSFWVSFSDPSERLVTSAGCNQPIPRCNEFRFLALRTRLTRQRIGPQLKLHDFRTRAFAAFHVERCARRGRRP